MKESAKQLFLEALQVSDPSKLIEKNLSIRDNHISIQGKEYELKESQEKYIIAIGKASRPMAKALQIRLGILVSNIICITPDKNPKEAFCISSSHPLPDKESEDAAQKLTAFINDIAPKSLIFFALSGGASSLVCKPADGITIEQIRLINDDLLKSGAIIAEINCVRKHLSAIKGGQLLNHFKPDATLIDLVISDVPYDNLEVIGGGLTISDSSTFQEAYDILLRYKIWSKAAKPIQHHIKKGLSGEIPETLKPGKDPLNQHDSFIIGSAQKFAQSMATEAKKEGFKTWIAKEPFNQPVEQVAGMISKKIDEMAKERNQPMVLVFYGESTVKVTRSGKGGRNQELALYGALKIQGMEHVTWLSAGTDGVDGPTDAAGAVVNGKTIKQANEKGLDSTEFLKNNDSYHFHEELDTLLKTGPTGNNVMDVTVIIIEELH